MSVQITDCTIRDGGYLFNKNSNPEFVKGLNHLNEFPSQASRLSREYLLLSQNPRN